MKSFCVPIRLLMLFLFAMLTKSATQQLCDGVSLNTRMPSSVISSPTVYTALQCEDRCFRNPNCYGFNFKPGINRQYAICQLVQLDQNVTVTSSSTGFFFKMLDREELRRKWTGLKTCTGCSSRQECKRFIDSCNSQLCQCKNGYLEDENGKCSYVACANNSLLTKDEGNITVPTKINDACANGITLLMTEHTCYSAISFASERNITLKIGRLNFNQGIQSNCPIAKQYMEIIAEGNTLQRICGNNVNLEYRFSVKKIYLKFLFKRFSAPCGVTLNASYRVEALKR